MLPFPTKLSVQIQWALFLVETAPPHAVDSLGRWISSGDEFPKELCRRKTSWKPKDIKIILEERGLACRKNTWLPWKVSSDVTKLLRMKNYRKPARFPATEAHAGETQCEFWRNDCILPIASLILLRSFGCCQTIRSQELQLFLGLIERYNLEGIKIGNSGWDTSPLPKGTTMHGRLSQTIKR